MCITNYVNSFEVYDDFIGQKILKLWRQKSRTFRPWLSCQYNKHRLLDLPSSVVKCNRSVETVWNKFKKCSVSKIVPTFQCLKQLSQWSKKVLKTENWRLRIYKKKSHSKSEQFLTQNTNHFWTKFWNDGVILYFFRLVFPQIFLMQ